MKKSVNAVDYAEESNGRLFFVLQKDDEVDEPEIEDLYTTGVVAKILQVLKLPDGTVKLLVEGLQRGRLLSIADERDCYFANVSLLVDDEVDAVEEPALFKMLAESFNTYAEISKKD